MSFNNKLLCKIKDKRGLDDAYFISYRSHELSAQLPFPRGEMRAGVERQAQVTSKKTMHSLFDGLRQKLKKEKETRPPAQKGSK